MKIFYGIIDNKIDVTNICLEKLLKLNEIIIIPKGDGNRAEIFTDPLIGIRKSIFIEHNNIMNEYKEKIHIEINIKNNTIETIDENNIIYKINILHSKLKITDGEMIDELPEQKMAVRYLKGNEKVLEIGGNIGRNSLIISSILENSSNLVTLECDKGVANVLSINKDLNFMNFNIERSALSNRKLIQHCMDTMPSDILLPCYRWVDTITLNRLKNKYNIKFDTLVLDCEGAFYYILMDMPELLDNIKLIIMENDYNDISHKKYIDDILTKNNFYVAYSESGGWGPCYNNFFETWKKL